MYLRYFSTLAEVVRTYPQLQCRRAVRCRLPMSRTRLAEPVPLLLASPRLACSPPKMKMTRKWCVEPVPAWMLPLCPTSSTSGTFSSSQIFQCFVLSQLMTSSVLHLSQQHAVTGEPSDQQYADFFCATRVYSKYVTGPDRFLAQTKFVNEAILSISNQLFHWGYFVHVEFFLFFHSIDLVY